MVKYKSRIADRILERQVLGKGAVLIEGPKWCGKTTTAKQMAKSVLNLGDSAVLNQSAQMIDLSPAILLEGDTPRLIDEWQALPQFGTAFAVRWIRGECLHSLFSQVRRCCLMPMPRSIVAQVGLRM